MCPVENESFGCVWMRAEVSHKRLNTGQQSSDESNDCVRILGSGNRSPTSQFHENQNKRDDSQCPCHQQQNQVILQQDNELTI